MQGGQFRLTWKSLAAATADCWQDLMPIREALEGWAARFHMGGVEWFLAWGASTLHNWAQQDGEADLDDIGDTFEDTSWSTPGPDLFQFPALEWDPRYIDRQTHRGLVLEDFERQLDAYYAAKEAALKAAGDWRAVDSEIQDEHLRALVYFHCLGKPLDDVAAYPKPGMLRDRSVLWRWITGAASKIGLPLRPPNKRGRKRNLLHERGRVLQ